MQAKHTTTVLVVTVVAGLLFGISASNAREQGSLAETNLAGLVAQQQDAVVELEDCVDGLRRQQDDLVASQISAAPAQSAILALRGEMVGPGLTVMLDDAPADFQLEDSISVNDAIVHQQDVDAAVRDVGVAAASEDRPEQQRLAA